MLFPSTPVEFVSDYSVEESIERLRAVVKRSVFQAPFQEAAVGRISPRRVSIQRVCSLAYNSFKPHFIGKFESTSGQVLLKGVFTISLFTRLGVASVFAFLGIECLNQLGQGAPNAGVFILVVIGSMGVGFGLMYLGNWFSRHDIPWLSSHIRRALSRSDADLVLTASPCVKSRQNEKE